MESVGESHADGEAASPSETALDDETQKTASDGSNIEELAIAMRNQDRSAIVRIMKERDASKKAAASGEGNQDMEVKLSMLQDQFC